MSRDARNANRVARIAGAVSPVFKKHAVVRAYLFGSQARGDQGASSDVDLYCTIDRAKPFGMFAYGALANDLQAALGLPVDLVTADHLDITNPRLFKEIERDKVMVYERATE